ncbi:MAG: filamentous hemagglutinin N-terminal domain-containing protein [Myxococcota bacterium]
MAKRGKTQLRSVRHDGRREASLGKRHFGPSRRTGFVISPISPIARIAGITGITGFIGVAGLVGFAGVAHSQVVLDPSFSPDTVAHGEYAPGQNTDYLIRESYGQRSGDNLFHRFTRFDIPAGESATFVADAPGSGIQRIISHVGGASPSQIDGVLRSTIPGADLYLLNPRGVIFGSGASLDLAGAFYASSADHLRFQDNVRFGDTEGGPSITLSAAEPAAWGFLQSAPAEIASLGAELVVPENEALSLVGGNLRIEGPGTTSFPNLAAPSGALSLVAVGSPGEVAVDPTTPPDLSAFERLGEIAISNNAVVDASGVDDQSLVIAGDALLLDDASLIAQHTGAGNHPGVAVNLQLRRLIRFGDSAAGTTGQLISTALRSAGDPGPDVGDGGIIRLSAEEIRLEETGTRLIVGNACAGSLACAAADQPGGAGGDLEIDADRFAVRNGAIVVVQTVGDGDGSDAQIRARRVEIGNDPGIAADTFILTFNAGQFDLGTTPPNGQDAQGGDITIEASESLVLENSGRIQSFTWNNGAGGDLAVNAGEVQLIRTDSAALVPRSGIFSETGGTISTAPTAGLGQAGDVRVVSGGDISVESGFIRSSTASQSTGSTGEVSLFAENGTIRLGSGALVDNQISDGVGGDVEIRAERLLLRDGATVSSTLQNEGVAGDIRIFADEILVSGVNSADSRSLIASRPFLSGGSGAGSSGNVEIEGRRLLVEDGAAISVSTIQFGNAGSIRIGQAAPLESVVIDNASIEAESTRGTVTSGDIEINADRVLLDNGARVSSSHTGPGDAGTIAINGRSLRLRNGSLLETNAGNSGSGGGIDLQISREVILNQSALRTETRGAMPNTQGGNIDITSQVVILANSTLGASAPVGSGGQIRISGGRFVSNPGSSLDASGGVAALDGIVQILSAETNTQNAVPRPSIAIKDPTRRLATGCEARTEALGSLYVAPPIVQGPPGENLRNLPSQEMASNQDALAARLANRCGSAQ